MRVKRGEKSTESIPISAPPEHPKPSGALERVPNLVVGQIDGVIDGVRIDPYDDAWFEAVFHGLAESSPDGTGRISRGVDRS